MFSTVFIFAVLILLFYRNKRDSKKSDSCTLPDGPGGLPIFGNLFQVIVSPHKKFSEWAYKYGSFYSVNIFGRPALVLNDVKSMRQALSTMESTGRFKFDILDGVTDGLNGLVSAEGKEWHEVRMLTMKALRNCGMMRSSVVEPAVARSFEEIVLWLEAEAKNGASNGVVFPLREKFIHSLSNSVWSIVSRTDCGKSEMGRLVVQFVDMLQVTTNSGLLFFPWLKYIAPDWSGYNKAMRVNAEIQQQVQKYFDQRKLERQNNEIEPENRNLLDIYMDKWENCTDPNSCFYGENGWKHGFYSVVVLLLAGGETTATTLNWMINYLVAHPEVQQKLFEEVDNAFGNNNKPSLADKQKLPYLEAVTYETLRMSSLLPFGVIQSLMDAVNFQGHQLPKDMLLIANIYHAHNDKAIWGDPENFRPERFLEVDDAQRSRLKDSVVSFQAGKRICPGEGLARDVLFLVGASLVQKFEFLPAPGRTPREYIEPVVGYMLMPSQIGVKVKARCQ